MNYKHRQLLNRAAISLSFILPMGSVFAQGNNYPDKPITMVVPFTAAGPTDSLARTLAQSIRKEINQSVVIENKPGAGGNIGATHVAKSPADGYTLLFGSSGPLFINTSLYKNPGFNPVNDFTPIAYIGEIPNVLVVNTNSNMKNLADLMQQARTTKGLSYGSSGNGSTNHLAGELFNKQLGGNIVHAPYRGTAPALNDLLGGQINMMFLDVLTAAPHIRSGKLKPLGVASSKRSHVLPEVPTFREQGMNTLEQGVAFGLVGPAGIPADTLEKISAAAQKALNSKEMQDALQRQGVETNSAVDNPEKFKKFSQEQIEAWRNVVNVTSASVE